MVAADALPDEQIAARLDVSRQTLANWKKHPAFMDRVEEHLTAARAAIKALGIANRQNRVDALNDRWSKMQTVIAERAADESSGAYETHEDADGNKERIVAPGWKTGLLVRTEKQIGAGERAVHVVEFAVDTGLLRELRAHEEQAAKELGQWEDKHRIDGEMIVREYVGIDVDDV